MTSKIDIFNALNAAMTQLNDVRISGIKSTITAAEAFKIINDVCFTLKDEIRAEQSEQSGGDE